MKKLIVVSSVLLLGAAAFACGGQVVFEESNDGGAGGSGTGSTGTKSTTGTKGTSGTNATNATNNSSVSTVNGTSGQVTTSSGGCSVPVPPPNNCEQACTTLYACGQTFCGGQQQLCPAFTPNIISQDQFLMGCIPQCSQQMALISIIDPMNCDATIETLIGVSSQFGELCGSDF